MTMKVPFSRGSPRDESQFYGPVWPAWQTVFREEEGAYITENIVANEQQRLQSSLEEIPWTFSFLLPAFPLSPGREEGPIGL